MRGSAAQVRCAGPSEIWAGNALGVKPSMGFTLTGSAMPKRNRLPTQSLQRITTVTTSTVDVPGTCSNGVYRALPCDQSNELPTASSPGRRLLSARMVHRPMFSFSRARHVTWKAGPGPVLRTLKVKLSDSGWCRNSVSSNWGRYASWRSIFASTARSSVALASLSDASTRPAVCSTRFAVVSTSVFVCSASTPVLSATPWVFSATSRVRPASQTVPPASARVPTAAASEPIAAHSVQFVAITVGSVPPTVGAVLIPAPACARRLHATRERCASSQIRRVYCGCVGSRSCAQYTPKRSARVSRSAASELRARHSARSGAILSSSQTLLDEQTERASG